MVIPDLPCKIDVYCSINPSEDPQKIKQAVSNVFENMEIKIEKDLLKANSQNLESLSKIHDVIHNRGVQKTYRYHLNKNLLKNSTWFYINKQAAFVSAVSLCEEAEESPLGPITVTLTSRNIEKIIEWLVFT